MTFKNPIKTLSDNLHAWSLRNAEKQNAKYTVEAPTMSVRDAFLSAVKDDLK